MKTLLNVIWLVFAGFWMAVGYVVAAILLGITIIGIPSRIADIKMAGAALVPFGRSVVRASELNVGVASASSTVPAPS
ncbi:MAG: YccF domain-containing protein [Gaiellales bacterium]